jgi:hypothetical protein
MATITTRASKGSALTFTEMDSNFTNLNTDKLELSGGTLTGNLVMAAGKTVTIGNDYTFPTADGTVGQVLQTDGNGNLSFVTGAGGGIALTDLSVGAEGTAAGDGSLAYNNTTGVFTYTPPVLSGLSGDSDDITEGATNQYYTDTKARASISVGSELTAAGDGAITYTSGTGVLQYTPPTIEGLGGIVADTTPQLGGDLDVNGNDIVSVSNGDIAIAPNGTGSVKLDNNVKVQGGATDGRYLVVDNFDGATPVTFGYNSPGITIASKGTGDNRDFPGMILHSSSSSSSAYSSIWIQRNKNDDPGTTGYLADNERVFSFYGSADRGGFYYNQMAGIEYRSSEAHSASAQGGKIEFYTMPNGVNSFGSQTKKMTIDEDVEIHDHMVLHNQSGDPSTVTDASHIYAKDDASSSEVYVRDEAGNITKISPHNEQGEWEYFSRNVKTGKTVRINMEEMIRDIEQLTGKTYIKDE